ncbi:N-terminal nucleophile aminohydrolase [Gonapodya prolifera JEL478]|uniref:Proteasome subunit beta n=1 Tax=Gonapodya prolifera (strain JEL478) TaxID=1344416 RepID=A0A139AKB4_GONPJ|nr:N-terminal nucleophile aminohydrolase [Gonapodya prolifera JEL478]|eukprot:KXS17217.1 N-terminal nucleophile aminohydrolase [Gonapodya prolifera JEL478]
MTGTSVLAIKYKDGIMMAGDTLSSYGSLARFRDTRRIVQAGDYTVVGATGEVSDYQHIKHLLEEVLIEEYYTEDGHKLGPRNIFEYLSRVMYNRRSNFNPLWNYLVVAGFKEGDKFLGYVDLRGTTYQASTIATGYGSMIAQPLLRKAVEGRENEVTEEEALKLLEDSMRILWYRDARAWDKIQVAKVTSEGVTISEPYKLTTDWTVGEYVKGYGA